MTIADSNETSSITGSSETMDKARTEATHLAASTEDAAKEIVDSHFKQSREATSDELDSASDTLSDIASTLEDNDSPFASYAAELSDQLSSFSGKLSTSSIDDLVGGARSLARDNPAAFMLGSVAIGLAASRFFKATAEQLGDKADYSSSSQASSPVMSDTNQVTTEAGAPGASSSSPSMPSDKPSTMDGSVGTLGATGVGHETASDSTQTSHLPHSNPDINDSVSTDGSINSNNRNTVATDASSRVDTEEA